MDSISPADRLVLLLRQKLEERARIQRGPAGRQKSGTVRPVEATGIQALASLETADERSLHRAIVQNLLADQLGQDLVNDAQFQQIVTRVSDALEDDATASALMRRVLADVRSR